MNSMTQFMDQMRDGQGDANNEVVVVSEGRRGSAANNVEQRREEREQERREIQSMISQMGNSIV